MRLPPSTSRGPHRGLAIAGLLLVGVTTILGSGFNPLALLFVPWAALPYAVLWGAGRWLTPWAAAGAGAAALAVDIGIRAAVFLWPAGSTAAVALVFSPAFVLLLALPAGAAAGWVIGRVSSRSRLAAVPLVGVGLTAIGLTVIGLARPELFPTTIIARRALLERLGPPRILVGADAFAWESVTTTSAWYQAAELDGQPGDEIAVVDSRGAVLIDPRTLEERGRLTFSDGPERAWGSFSALVRHPDGRHLVAHTGGGFSRTRVMALDGRQVWELGANERLNPSALRPADLDGDGQVEFYGAMTDAVVRLDADGRESWRQPTKMAAIVSLLARTADAPAWIVGTEYGRKASVWDANGRLLGERAVTQAANTPMAAVDSFAGRALVVGGRSVRGFDLSGAELFDIPLGDFTANQILSMRFGHGDPPSLVIVGATDRHTSRYRLLVVGAGPTPRFDELLDEYPRVVVAQTDEADVLLVGRRRGLDVLRAR